MTDEKRPVGRPPGPVVPQTKAGLIRLFRETGALHLHLKDTYLSGRHARWGLVMNRTRVCGTERCAWIKLQQG